MFTVDGETPAKKNSRINLRNGVSIPSKRYQEWHKSASFQLNNQILLLGGMCPIDYPVSINLEFIHGDLRRRDSDNGCSSIMDLLCDSGILADDKWEIVQRITISNDYQKNKARCIISIEKLEEKK